MPFNCIKFARLPVENYQTVSNIEEVWWVTKQVWFNKKNVLKSQIPNTGQKLTDIKGFIFVARLK